MSMTALQDMLRTPEPSVAQVRQPAKPRPEDRAREHRTKRRLARQALNAYQHRLGGLYGIKRAAYPLRLDLLEGAELLRRRVRQQAARQSSRRGTHRRQRCQHARRERHGHHPATLVAAGLTVLALVLTMHQGKAPVTAIHPEHPGVRAVTPAQPAPAALAAQANAVPGGFPTAITRWQPQVDRALLDPRTATSYLVKGNTQQQHLNILALPGQRSIIYNLMRFSGGNPGYQSGGRMGLLPLSLAQRRLAAHEMGLHYETRGADWPFNNLLIGIRTANDTLFGLMMSRRAVYQHQMCIQKDNGQGLIRDFLSRWDPAMNAAQKNQFVSWYVQWGPKGLDRASLTQFCAGAK